MRPKYGYIALAAAIAATAPAVARAQDSTIAQKREAAMILDYNFNAPTGEPVKVFLAKGVKYRADIQGQGITLQLRPIEASVQSPLLQKVLGGRTSSASGETLYTITPRADAEYMFITVGGTPGRSVKLRVYALPADEKKKP